MKNLTLTQVQVKELGNYIESRKARSAWGKGVREFAMDLLYYYSESIRFSKLELNQETLLNGATDWSQYSYGGCALICDYQIAERLCNNTELKRTSHGERNPNRNETWLDVQARALSQAAKMLIGSAKYLFVYGKN